ncbi:zinc finger protein 22-like isoform X2 [Cydia pomonella]|uniref:zinc finger protein 22-like isoform X2 n=1 Tax=Cydia pomonella TaxID=82600 RepID=UPI002ADE8463|nr:zinc finger protein 22-like isoform X2 [Cydia pomonella]
MDVMHSCRCCLRSPPDKDLTTPYTYHGKTEIYYDMIKECFDIRLVLDGSGSCGICSACVSRLRDASDFKLQVQHSQAELQRVLLEPAVKSELIEDGARDVLDLLHVELIEKPEMIAEQMGEVLNEDPLVKPTASDMSEDYWTLAATPPDQRAARAKDQLSRITSRREKKRVKRKKETKKPHDNNTFTKQSCMNGNKLYVCETCGKQSKARYLLIRHIKTHMAREGHPCKICNKSLLTYSDLKRHQLIHKGEKRYTCEECKLRFSQKGNLDRHRRIHTGERPFVCDECDKQFANKSNLDRHKKLHTGDKPYMCEKCTKRFTQKGNLRIHKCSVYNVEALLA